MGDGFQGVKQKGGARKRRGFGIRDGGQGREIDCANGDDLEQANHVGEIRGLLKVEEKVGEDGEGSRIDRERSPREISNSRRERIKECCRSSLTGVMEQYRNYRMGNG